MTKRNVVKIYLCSMMLTCFIIVSCTPRARAQGNSTTATPQTPQQTVSPPQPATPAAPLAATAKKSNARPTANAKAVEPFDNASVAKMAEQCVVLETEAGTIELETLPEAAPDTVRNFLNLVATGAFDTTTFSRVVEKFVVQGGDLSTRQTFTPMLSQRAARTLHDEPNYIKHVRGVVSMARGDEPNSAATSFFILVGDAPHLDGTFAAFGRVRTGMEVVDAINTQPATNEKPLKPVRVTRALIKPCAPAAAAH